MRYFFKKYYMAFLILLFLIPGKSQAQENDKSYQFSYAVKLFTDGFTELASQQFSQYINRYPGDAQLPEAHFYLAKCYEKLKQDDLAVIEYRKLALDYPGHEKAKISWKEIGRLLKKEKKYAEAAKAFENLNILYNGSDDAPEGLLLAGEAFYLQRDYENSSRVLNTLISRYPESTQVFDAELWLARLAVADKNYPEAVTRLKKVVRGAEGEVKNRALLQLAEAYLGLNNIGSATEIIETLPQKAYNKSFVQLKVQLYWKQKKYSDAVQFLSDLDSKIVPKSLLLDAYLLAGNYQNALLVVDGIEPKNEPILKLKKLIILVHLNKHQDVLEQISQWKNSKNDENFKRVIEKYVLQLEQKNQFDKVIELLETIQSSYSAEDFAKNFTQNYCRALWETKQGDKLINFVRKNEALVGTSKGADEALWYLGNAFYDQKNYVEAASSFERLIRSFVYSPYWEKASEKLSFIRNFLLSGSAENSSALMDFLATTINERENTTKLNLLLAKMAVEMYKDFPRALRYLKMARLHASEEQLIEINRELYFTYFAHFKVSGNKESLDSARIYLKRFLQTGADESAKAQVSLHFFKYTAEEIKNNPERLKTVLKQLKNWRTEKLIAEKKVNELFFELAPGDSTYQILNRKGTLAAEHPGKWILKAVKTAARKKDTAFVKEQCLEIVRRYRDRPEAYRAGKMLLNYYKTRGNAGNYSQIAGFLKTNAWYNDNFINAEMIMTQQLRNGNTDDILKEFERRNMGIPNDAFIIRELYPDFLELLYFAAKANYVIGKPELALPLFNRFLSISDTQNQHLNEIYKMLGEVALQEKRYSDAIWYLSLFQYAGNEDEFAGVGETIIRLQESRKNFTAVENEAIKLIKILPKYPHRIKWEYNILNAQLRINNGKNFNTLVTGFRKKFGKNKESKLYIGKLYLTQIDIQRQNKNFKIVETLLKKGEKAGDNSLKPDFLYWKGYIATIRNRDEEAMKYLAQFTEKYKSDELLSKVYATLGHLYYRSEKKKEALNAYVAALQSAVNPDDIKLSLNNLIILNKELGFWDAVLNYSQRFLREFPQDETVVDKQIWVGLSYSRLNRFDEAISYFRKIKPFIGADREPEAQFYIGEALFNGGRYREAISEFLKIPLLSKKTKLQWEASALYFAGQAYERLGKKDEAIHMYREIVKRPGILWELKKEAQKKISQLQ